MTVQEIITNYGIFGGLFLYMFFKQMKDSASREEKLMQFTSTMTEQMKDITIEMAEMKNMLKDKVNKDNKESA